MMSNIEDDLNILGAFCLAGRIEIISPEEFEESKIAIRNILSEREQDKAKIMKLEKEEGKFVDLKQVYLDNKNDIPKQKIKDAIEKIAEYKIARSTNKGYYYDYFINQDYKEDFIKLFNKLLED